MSAEVRRPDSEDGGKVGSGAAGPFARAFDATLMPMLITDPRRPDNPIVFVNDAFLNLTGYARDEIMGRNCRFLQGLETDQGTVARIRQAIAAGEGIETEILNYRKDGTPFWNALVISPVRDEANALTHFVGCQYDVTGQKSAAAELAQTKSSLEELVLRRTQDLQSALDQKTALLHEVDHRVKNNLQVISSLVLLKARRLDDPKARRALQDVAERISALSTVHRLLYSVGDVSRFDLAEFLSDLTDELATLVPAGQVAVDLKLESVAIPAAKAAPLALLVNEIVGNAFKHAFPDSRRGRVRVEVAKPEGELSILVEDDGIGIETPASGTDGFGRTLIEMLARQLKARIAWDDARPGTRALVTMPLDTEEAQF
jgi:PAS domain S-box-containing protein